MMILKDKRHKLRGTLNQLIAKARFIAEENRNPEGHRRWREARPKYGGYTFDVLIWGDKVDGASTVGGEIRVVKTPSGIELSAWTYEDYWPSVKAAWKLMVRELFLAGFGPKQNAVDAVGRGAPKATSEENRRQRGPRTDVRERVVLALYYEKVENLTRSQAARKAHTTSGAVDEYEQLEIVRKRLPTLLDKNTGTAEVSALRQKVTKQRANRSKHAPAKIRQ